MFKCIKTSQIIKRMVMIVAFLGVNTYVFKPIFSQGLEPATDMTRYNEVMSKVNSVMDPDKHIGNFDVSNFPSLPIGLAKEIGGNLYVICIDSAYFLKDGAYFSAYMSVELPNAENPLAFAAKDIKFNPEGVIGGAQSKLQLVSEHTIRIGANTELYIPGDGSNYVNWNCNGFESVNLHGKFLFSKEILIPKDDKAKVEAEFEVNVQDVNNIMTEVSFTKFAVKGMEDVSFEISTAVVDMSDNYNPQGAPMPQNFGQIYGGDIDLWRGFYVETFTVGLPNKLSPNGGGTEIYANHLFIDDAGVTGEFGANNVLALSTGEVEGGWGFSVEHIAVDIVTNSIVQGEINGQLAVPFLDDKAIDYQAALSKNESSGKLDYSFSMTANVSAEVRAFKSTLTIDPSSALTMTVTNNSFKPQLVLNGDWKLDAPKGTFQGIGFQNVTLITESPYISAGQFSLVGSIGAKMSGFSISLNNLVLGFGGGKVALGIGANLTIGKNFGVAGGFKVWSTISQDSNGKMQWEYDSFRIDSIIIDINTQAISVKGGVFFRYDDPIYGDGFAGFLEVGIGDVIEGIGLSCIFGKVDGYRYFAVDASVPVTIPIGNTGVTLTQISGGISYHMRDTRSAQSIMDQASAGTNSSVLSPTFIPDNTISLGFRAGVQFVYTQEQLLNGDVVFSIQFNSNGGLASVLLAGEAYMMVKRSERAGADNYVKGTVAVFFDNQNKIFDMQMQAEADFADAIYANIWSQLYISPSLWFFHLGTPNNPCVVNVIDLVTVNAYFMFGQNLPPMPPPPPQVSSVLGGITTTRDNASIASGSGIGTGMSINIGFDGEINFTGKWMAYASAGMGCGFDLTLYKYAPSYHCEGETGPFGAKYWFLQGQLYAYGGMAAGVKKVVDGEVKQDYVLINCSMAMLLSGKFPKPSYIYGGVALQAQILNVINVNVNAEFDAGTDCNIVQN